MPSTGSDCETEAAALPARADGSTFAINETATDSVAAWFAEGVSREFDAHGYTRQDSAGADTQIVLHVVDPRAPKPYRRRAAPTFVVGIGAVRERPDDLLR